MNKLVWSTHLEYDLLSLSRLYQEKAVWFCMVVFIEVVFGMALDWQSSAIVYLQIRVAGMQF